MTQAVFTFATTHHALWAEDTARGHGIAVEIVPAPPGANARCNLALECFPEDRTRLIEIMTDEGVPFREYVPRL
jgi:diphthamide biosynthesis methyltransferase